MKRSSVVFHQFFFAIYAVLGVYAPNIGSIPLKHVARPFLTISVILTLLYLFLRYITGDKQRAGFLTTVGLAWFFFGHPYRVLISFIKFAPSTALDFALLIVWSTVLYSLSSHRVWSKIKVQKILTDFLNVTSWVLLVLPLYLTITVNIQNLKQNMIVREQQKRNEIQLMQSASGKPDIYLIILDGYGRADFIEQGFHYNNSDFINFLKEKGFYVAEKSKPNYPQTMLSVASLLNMSYLDTWTKGMGASNNRAPLEEMINKSVTRINLERLGYRFLISSPFSQNINLEGYKQKPGLILNPFEELLLSTSVFDIFTRAWNLSLPLPTYDTHRNNIDVAFKNLSNLPTTDSPKFVFVHILAPHPPFVFDENGNSVEPDYPYTLSDGEAFPGSIEDYTIGYIKEIQYLNREMESVITTILETSNTPPIILLQGDHGPGNYFTILGLGTEPCLQERFSILNAYYFPDQSYNLLYPSVTPVNSFRIVFKKYFEAKLPLLEDRSYYASYANPYDFTDVTAEASTCSIDFAQ